MEERSERGEVPLYVVLEDLRSGLNVGSVFRTADAFGVAGVACCGYTARPPQRDLLKSALGAAESVEWRGFEDANEAIKTLRKEGYKIAAVEQVEGSLSMMDWKPKQGERWALVLGNEVRGVQDATVAACDVAVEIPQYGLKKSLNVSVCAGVVMWYASQRLRG